jgi:hypothetical protein
MKIFSILISLIILACSTDLIDKSQASQQKLNNKNVSARLVSDMLTTADVAYFFEDTVGQPFIDSSPNGRNIPATVNFPNRISEGIQFTSGKYFDLPNLPYKTLIFIHNIPSSTTGMLFRTAAGTVGWQCLFTSTGGNYSSMLDARKNGAVIPLDNSKWTKSEWNVATFISSITPTVATRIGKFNGGTTYPLTDGKIAAILGYTRVLTEDEINDAHNYAINRIASRGITINPINLPQLIKGVAPNATTYITSMVGPYTATTEIFAELGAIDIENFKGFGGTYAGYRYWMVADPLPGGLEKYENSCIFASNDGDNWVVPTGVTNPVISAPPLGSGNNSDSNLTFDVSTDSLYIFSRFTSGDTTWTQMMGSADGFVTHTTVKKITKYIAKTGVDATNELAPSVYKDPTTGLWIMLSAVPYNSPNHYKIAKRTSTDLRNWTSTTLKDLPSIQVPSDWQAWHGTAFYDTRLNCHVFVTSVSAVGGSGGVMRLKIYTSKDLENWYQSRDFALIPSGGTTNWDCAKIYRASFTTTSTGYNIFYCASGKGVSDPTINRFRIGRTFLPY